MRMLKLGTEKQFQVTCPACRSTFSYELSDVFRSPEGKLKDSISCMECKVLIVGLNYKELYEVTVS